MAVSPDNKALAIYLRSVLGGKPSVSKFWDDDHRSDVDIMRVADAPEAGITTIATLGLSDTAIALEVHGKPLRVELIMSYKSAEQKCENILATAAFNVINSSMAIRPGIVFPRIVEMYRPDSAMKHVLFSSPFLFELATQHLESKEVAWLAAIPISDAEYDHAREKGSDALEDALEAHDADVLNLSRPSVF